MVFVYLYLYLFFYEGQVIEWALKLILNIACVAKCSVPEGDSLP